MNYDKLIDLAAIVTSDIAAGAAITYAERSAPQDDTDSGWQFLGSESDYDWKTAQVWSLGEVIEFEPSLRAYINSPYGTKLTRSSVLSQWQIG